MAGKRHGHGMLCVNRPLGSCDATHQRPMKANIFLVKYFTWLPVAAALSIFQVSFFVTNVSYEGIEEKKGGFH